jgi:tetratricopeptide (TPR) repeat protein
MDSTEFKQELARLKDLNQRGDYQQALLICDHLAAAGCDDHYLMCALFLEVSQSLFRQGGFIQAIPYAKLLLFHAEHAHNTKALAEAYNNYGVLEQNLGNYQESIEWYEKARTLYQELGDQAALGRILGNISSVFNTIGKLAEAIEYLDISSELFLQAGAEQSLAINNSNAGLIFMNIGDYHKALQYMNQALKFYEKQGNIYGICVNLGNMAQAYICLEQHDAAIKYL